MASIGMERDPRLFYRLVLKFCCSCQAVMVLMVLGLLVLYGLLSIVGAETGSYLYREHDGREPILDYFHSNGESAENIGYPSFLNSTDHGAQVVEFYAPWCGHCQHYAPVYVELARSVQALPEGKDVKFHAISCTVHHEICKSEKVRGYPTVKFYMAGEAEGGVEPAKSSAEKVLGYLGIDRRDGGAIETKHEPSTKEHKTTPAAKRAPPFHERNSSELFTDAALSFHFALHQSIHTTDGPLDQDAKEAFYKWLVLLQRSLPVAMGPTHNEIVSLQQNFHNIVVAEETLKASIAGVKLNANTWSQSCTHGDNHEGYTCGLWELFHVMTVGVVVHNEGKSDSESKLSTLDAADTLRNYIQYFFQCEECRTNFLSSYDKCEFGRCERLHSNDSGTQKSAWRELPLWLWEVHNGVNVRLQRERLEQEGMPTPTKMEVRQVQWPSEKDCPRCWNADGSWDRDVVYNHLVLEYWPKAGGMSGGRTKNLRKRSDRAESLLVSHESGFFSASNKIVQAGTVLFLIAGWLLVHRQTKKNRYGRGKKFDRKNALPVEGHRREGVLYS